MAFAGVDHQHPRLARRLQHPPGRGDGRLQRRDVVAQRLAESARHDEIALHVDDQQRRGLRIELEFVRFRFDRLVRHLPPSRRYLLRGRGFRARPLAILNGIQDATRGNAVSMTISSLCSPTTGRASAHPAQWCESLHSARTRLPMPAPGSAGSAPDALSRRARQLEYLAARRPACHRPPAAVRDPVRGQGQHRRRRPADHGGLSRLFLRARALRHGGGEARGGRRHPGRQDQPGPVRHRAGRHALALRRGAQRVPARIHLRRLQLRFRGCGRARPGQLLARHRHRRIGPGAGGTQQHRRIETQPRPDQRARRGAGLPVARLRIGVRAYRARCDRGARRGARPGSGRSLVARPDICPRRRCRSASPSRCQNRSNSMATTKPGMRSTKQSDRLEGLGGKPVGVDFSVYLEAAGAALRRTVGGGAAGRHPAVLRKAVRPGAPGGAQDHRGRRQVLGRGPVFRVDQAARR